MQKIKSSLSIVVFFQEQQSFKPDAREETVEDALLKTLEDADKVLAEMEIPFVKSTDHGIAEEFGIGQLPSIVVFQVCPNSLASSAYSLQNVG